MRLTSACDELLLAPAVSESTVRADPLRTMLPEINLLRRRLNKADSVAAGPTPRLHHHIRKR